MADLKPLLKSEKSLKDRSAVTRPMENDEEKSSTKAAGVEGA
jgi:hypothetical protein